MWIFYNFEYIIKVDVGRIFLIVGLGSLVGIIIIIIDKCVCGGGIFYC